MVGGGSDWGLGGSDPPRYALGDPKSKESPNQNEHVCYLS